MCLKKNGTLSVEILNFEKIKIWKIKNLKFKIQTTVKNFLTLFLFTIKNLIYFSHLLIGKLQKFSLFPSSPHLWLIATINFHKTTHTKSVELQFISVGNFFSFFEFQEESFSIHFFLFKGMRKLNNSPCTF